MTRMVGSAAGVQFSMGGGVVAQLHRLLRCGLDARVVGVLGESGCGHQAGGATPKRKLRQGKKTMVKLFPTARTDRHLRYTYEPKDAERTLPFRLKPNFAHRAVTWCSGGSFRHLRSADVRPRPAKPLGKLPGGNHPGGRRTTGGHCLPGLLVQLLHRFDQGLDHLPRNIVRDQHGLRRFLLTCRCMDRHSIRNTPWPPRRWRCGLQ